MNEPADWRQAPSRFRLRWSSLSETNLDECIDVLGEAAVVAAP
jgi:hypothetical protein